MAIPDEVSLALTGGLAPGAKLRENRFFLLKETGVEFRGQLTYEQWLTGMRMLQMSKSALLLWQADFYREGMRLFGEKVVNDAISQLEFDFMDAQKAIAIAGLPEAVRQEGLTAEHYWVLARASQAGVDPVHWAKLAAEHKLAPTHLHQSIVAGKIVNTDDRSRAIGRGSGIATPHGVRQNFDLWLKQVEKEDPIERWDRERKKALLDELQPISVVVQRLQAELSAERSEVAKR